MARYLTSVVAVVAVGLLVGCVAGQDLADRTADATATADVHGDEIPEGFPDDVPLPDDYEIATSLATSVEGRPQFNVSLEVDAPPGEVADYYESALADAGWSVDRTDVRETDVQIIAEQDGGREVVVSISGSDEGTRIGILA